ncbi:MAG: EthD family reductase [Anaerolineae bacterium]
MFKFVTMYRRVDDQEAQELFFSHTHLPLAEQLPGLMKSEVSRISGKPGGESRFHMTYTLYFETEEQYFLALTTEPGQNLMAALKPWADARLITWFMAETYEEAAGLREETADEEE